MKTVITTIMILAISLSIGAGIILIGAYAQTSTSKIYRLGNDPSGTLDDFTYTNGEQISYDISGYPPITIVIPRWNEIPTVQKTLIDVRLTGMGYVAGEEFNPNTSILR